MFRKLIFTKQIQTIYELQLRNGNKILSSNLIQPKRFSCKKTEHDEVKAAHMAVKGDFGPTIFSKIIKREIPADIVYEDEQCLAFRDINPQAPCHILLIPKHFISQLCKVEDKDAPLLGHLMLVASKIAAKEKLEDGFRIIINDGKHGAQSVFHLHIHIMGGRQMKWPPG